MKKSHPVRILILTLFFLFECSFDKSPIKPESAAMFVVDSIFPAFVVKNNPDKNIAQGYISYELEYHFEHISGVITTINIKANDYGISLHGRPGSPIPVNVQKKINVSFWIGDNFFNIDSVTIKFHFGGRFYDGKNDYGSFSWDRDFKLPVFIE